MSTRCRAEGAQVCSLGLGIQRGGGIVTAKDMPYQVTTGLHWCKCMQGFFLIADMQQGLEFRGLGLKLGLKASMFMASGC